jgi:hypothetical protein
MYSRVCVPIQAVPRCPDDGLCVGGSTGHGRTAKVEWPSAAVSIAVTSSGSARTLACRMGTLTDSVAACLWVAEVVVVTCRHCVTCLAATRADVCDAAGATAARDVRRHGQRGVQGPYTVLPQGALGTRQCSSVGGAAGAGAAAAAHCRRRTHAAIPRRPSAARVARAVHAQARWPAPHREPVHAQLPHAAGSRQQAWRWSCGCRACFRGGRGGCCHCRDG